MNFKFVDSEPWRFFAGAKLLPWFFVCQEKLRAGAVSKFYLLDVPSGAAIILASAVIFVLATIFSPKRKVKQWQGDE